MAGPTYVEQLQNVARQYRMAGMPWPASSKQIAAWAIDEELWKPHPNSMISRLAEDLSRALREEYFLDPQGRSVRAKHAARIKTDDQQLVLWDDIRTASRDHMVIALQQRRQQIVGDCRQLKLDADSYNENANPGAPVQLVLDFTQDVAELEALDAMQLSLA